MKIVWRRDSFGDEAERVLPGGLSALWSRDPSRRPTGRFVVQETHGKTVGTSGWSQTYEWTPGNRLAAVHDSRFGLTELEHDARGRVIAERSGHREQVRAFDAAGNVYRSRDQSDRRYRPGGAVRVAGWEEVDHDLTGNVVRRWTTGTNEGWEYSWDGAGNLVRASSLEAGPAVSFTYDALGRRVGKLVGDRATTFVWLGDHLLHEVPGDVGRLVTWYPDPAAGGPLAKFVGERRFTIIADHLGTPAAVHDETGRSVLDIQLDVYGMPRPAARPLSDGDGTDCDWRWPGQYADAETGLHYNRFRYYDPKLGSYISRDPIGLLGGLATYAYVRDPTTWIDPLGLSACTIRRVLLADPPDQRSIGRADLSRAAAQNEGRSPPPWAITDASEMVVGQGQGSPADPSPLAARFSRWPA